jgi:hypothetical protein
MATLARRLAGIRAAHVERGFLDPTKGELIRLTFRGIRRRYGKPQRRIAPLRIEHLSAVISELGNSPRDIPGPGLTADRVRRRISQIRAQRNSMRLGYANRAQPTDCASQNQNGSREQGTVRCHSICWRPHLVQLPHWRLGWRSLGSQMERCFVG